MEKAQKENMPLISIIIPYYNSVEYLKRCVDSLTSQTYQNLEILLIDDGSGDESASLADSLADDDLRVKSFHLPHKGVSAARNAGIERASGEYIMFIDSDDWMSPQIIRRMWTLRQKTDADLVTCELKRAEEMDEFFSPSHLKYTVYDKDDYLRLFFKIGNNEWVHFPVAKLYTRSLLPSPLYPEDIRVGEDVLGTYLALKKTKKIARLREIGYYYFLNPQSATSSFSEKDFDLLSVWDQVVSATEKKEPDYSYAKLNRDRINFTLLLRLLTEVPAKERKQKYGQYQKQLLADLKSCESELLSSQIVTSRKILIFLMCHCFPLISFAGSLYVKLGHLFKSKLAVAQRRPLS